MAVQLIETGRRRVLVQNVRPEIEAGDFPIKRIVGQRRPGKRRRIDRRARPALVRAEVPQGRAARLERGPHGTGRQ